jgi:hypothetical protein
MMNRSDKMMGEIDDVVKVKDSAVSGRVILWIAGSEGAPVRHAAEARLQADQVDRIPPHSIRPLSPSAALSQPREGSARPQLGVHPKFFIFYPVLLCRTL